MLPLIFVMSLSEQSVFGFVRGPWSFGPNLFYRLTKTQQRTLREKVHSVNCNQPFQSKHIKASEKRRTITSHLCGHLSFLYCFEFQAAEGRNALSENERDPIKVFDPESPVFLACVIALSIFLIFCLVGCGMGVFLTKYLNRKKMDISAVDNNSGELKLITGTRAFRPPH